MKWLIRGRAGNRLQNQVDDLMDIYIHQGKILDLLPVAPRRTSKNPFPIFGSFRPKGWWLPPDLIDMHTHLREPGFEYKETILTGTQAAVAGGFTAVACMANTHAGQRQSVGHGIYPEQGQRGPAGPGLSGWSRQCRAERGGSGRIRRTERWPGSWPFPMTAIRS